MFTSRASPPSRRHEQQPSKYFASARSTASMSPPALAASVQRKALSSTPFRSSAFVSAASLISKPVFANYAYSPAKESAQSQEPKASGPDVIAPKHVAIVKTVEKQRGGAAKKKLAKSAEFILDSDESDAQPTTSVAKKRIPTVATSNSAGKAVAGEAICSEQSSYFGTNIEEARPDVPADFTNHALNRQRSWTPLKDTIPQESEKDASAQSPKSGANFSTLIRGFEYENSETNTRTPAAEPPAKKRKLSAPKRGSKPKVRKAKEPKAPKVPKVKVPKPPKEPRVKKPKKKAQTITALAMAPYQPQVVDAQITIPEVLAATKPMTPAPIEINGPAKATTAKRKSTGASSPKAKRAKKPAKPKQPKAEEIPRFLLPPTQAQGALEKQTFIFGTSSQLHVEETPETLQQIQLALQESEVSPVSAHSYSPTRRSCMKVPTAPHGTSLSIGQANRDLWCVSARDENGTTLVADNAASQESDSGAHSPQQTDQACIELLEVERPCTDLPLQNDSISKGGQEPSVAHDSFITISSDSASQEELDALPLKQVLARLARDSPRTHTSPARLRPPWQSSQRCALQPLDANLGIRPIVDDLKQVRAISTQPTIPDNAVQPKRRGRPPKALQRVPDDANVVQISSSPAALRQSKARKSTSPSKILATLHSSPPSEWHNIDEISDFETPPMPSPPRKRKDKSPAIEKALELSGEEDIEDLPPVYASKAPSKENESPWIPILVKLNPRITSTIRSVPRSNSLTNPTWHEKILLYDPIVIEDLTTWLNAQGLRVTVRRSKAKARKTMAEQEGELVDEELSHWMVQKWCEEHSICCLWKEGLRGGVRTRY